MEDLDDVIQKWESLRGQSKYSDHSNLPKDQAVEVITRARTAIWRWTRPGDHYRQVVEDYNSDVRRGDGFIVIDHLAGVLKSLRSDYANGRLSNIENLIVAEAFSDFLDMAEHFLENKYKDAAAVMIGSVLEQHLKKLCGSHQIDILKPPDRKQHKKATLLSHELAAVSAYSKGDLKMITAWLAIRNHAAHGDYLEYSFEQIRVMLPGVRDFINRNPA